VQTYLNRWAPPRKPAVLRAGIALAVLNIVAVLAIAAFAASNTGSQHLALAMQLIGALILRGIIGGTPHMRWVYIGYDLLQIGLSIWLHGAPGDLEAVTIALNLAVWVCFLMPASHAWFRRMRAHYVALRRDGPAESAEFFRNRAQGSLQLGVICLLFFLYTAWGLRGPIFWLLAGVCVIPLAACVALEVMWYREKNSLSIKPRFDTDPN